MRPPHALPQSASRNAGWPRNGRWPCPPCPRPGRDHRCDRSSRRRRSLVDPDFLPAGSARPSWVLPGLYLPDLWSFGERPPRGFRARGRLGSAIKELTNLPSEFICVELLLLLGQRLLNVRPWRRLEHGTLVPFLFFAPLALLLAFLLPLRSGTGAEVPEDPSDDQDREERVIEQELDQLVHESVTASVTLVVRVRALGSASEAMPHPGVGLDVLQSQVVHHTKIAAAE